MRFIAVSDADPAKARDLAQKTGAQFHSGDNTEIISRPEVNAVIVSTSEGEHLAPMLKAIELGKPVLVEKPIALTLADADRVIHAVEKAGANVRVGYSRRYKERYLIAKEQIVQGRVGTIVGGAARVYNSRSQGMAVLNARPARHARRGRAHLLRGPDGLAAGRHAAAEVYARGQKGVLSRAGFEANDVDWAVFTYADGTVVNLGISYALPEKYPGARPRRARRDPRHRGRDHSRRRPHRPAHVHARRASRTCTCPTRK